MKNATRYYTKKYVDDRTYRVGKRNRTTFGKIVNAPFVKVEATKFTEVGYVGRDVESMVRDLVENAIQIVEKSSTAVYTQC